jgi:TolB protein
MFVLLAGQSARAEMTIEIVGGGASKHAIAVVPFKDETTRMREALTPIIRSDLELSGVFRMVDGSAIANVPVEPVDIRYPLWQAAGAQSIAIGKVEAVPVDR